MELSPPSLRFLPSREAGLSGGGRGYLGATKGHAVVGRRVLQHLNGQRQLSRQRPFSSSRPHLNVGLTRRASNTCQGWEAVQVRPCNDKTQDLLDKRHKTQDQAE